MKKLQKRAQLPCGSGWNDLDDPATYVKVYADTSATSQRLLRAGMSLGDLCRVHLNAFAALVAAASDSDAEVANALIDVANAWRERRWHDSAGE